MKTKSLENLARQVSHITLHLLLSACCLLPLSSLYAQTSDELMLQRQQREAFEKQRAEERKTIGKTGGNQTRIGDLYLPPNPGSIHVNRDTVYRKYTPQQLVDSIFVKGGACVSVGNVELYSHGWDGFSWGDEDNRGLGYFSRGDSNFEFAEGLVLSTGGLVSIEGPNTDPSGVEPPMGEVLGDTDLQGLVSNVRNVSVLTFDFVPVGNVIQFRYIFASEEYLQYANSQYNDVFGFFITNQSTGVPQNIAILPTTTSGDDIVSINNVNAGTVPYNEHNCPYPPYVSNVAVNPEYYINIPGLFSSCDLISDPLTDLTNEELILLQSMEFNGRTVVLIASATVTPCQTYTLKLAVGNAADNAFQSGVFLEAYSFNMGDNVVNYGNGIEGMDFIYRGCQNNKFIVTRPAADPTPLSITLTYGGTAVNGVDISNYPGGGALPTTVVIPAGSSSVEVPYQANMPPSGYKILTITTNCPCSSSGEAYTKTLHIYDPSPSTDFQATSSPSCPGTSSGMIHITANAGGSGCYESSINGGTTWVSSLLGHTGLAPGTYTVHARDSGSCFSTILSNIVVMTANATVNAGPNQTSCGTNVFTMAAQPLAAGQTGRWTVISGTASIANIFNPTTNVTVTGTSATLRWTLSYSVDCQVYADVVLTVGTNAIVSLTASPTSVCSGASSTLTAVISGASTASTTYTWYIGATPQATTTTNTYNTGPITANSSYTVRTNNGSCTGTSNMATVTVNANPSVSLAASPSTICSGSTSTLTATVTGGTTTAMTYTWYSGATQLGTTTVNSYNVSVAGTYSVMVRNGNGCTGTSNTATVTVVPLVTPTITVSASNNNVCSGTSITYTANITNGGTSPGYQWRINGTPVGGATAATYTYEPANGDIITCVLTSNAACANPTTVTSTPGVTMIITPTVVPSVTIIGVPN